MIYTVKGKIILVKDDFVIIGVSGIGYKVFVGAISLEIQKNQDIFLYTHQVVRENALDLFGFKKESELQLFELLISISGIGPKVAMAILTVTTPKSLKRAVLSQNLEELTKVSGIGKKNAQKILIELASKIDRIEVDLSKDDDNFDMETYDILEALGFDRIKIRETLKEINGGTTKEKIKEALKILGNK